MTPAVALIVATLRDPDVRAALREALGTATADPWVTLADAARIAGVRPRVLRDAAREGRIVLGRGVVRRSELDRWLAARPAPTKATAANDTDERTSNEAARAATIARVRGGSR
jgi:hypothetical protein